MFRNRCGPCAFFETTKSLASKLAANMRWNFSGIAREREREDFFWRMRTTRWEWRAGALPTVNRHSHHRWKLRFWRHAHSSWPHRRWPFGRQARCTNRWRSLGGEKRRAHELKVWRTCFRPFVMIRLVWVCMRASGAHTVYVSVSVIWTYHGHPQNVCYWLNRIENCNTAARIWRRARANRQPTDRHMRKKEMLINDLVSNGMLTCWLVNRRHFLSYRLSNVLCVI